MATTKTIDVRCPRCATKIQLTISYAVKLIQIETGRKSFITVDVGHSGIEHTCPDDREY